MAEGFSNRYGRQYGLVHQDVVENLNVLVVGDNPILSYLLVNLAFCGVGNLQGGVYLAGCSESVGARHLRHQFLLRQVDSGKDLVGALRERIQGSAPSFDLQKWPVGGERNVVPDVTLHLPTNHEIPREFDFGRCSLFGQVTEHGFVIAHAPIDVAVARGNVLTPSLASLAGAILAQEVLRVSNALRHFTIADQSVEVSLRIRSSEVLKFLTSRDRSSTPHGIVARLRLGGENLEVRFVQKADRPDEALFRVALPPQTLLSRVISDSIEIVEEPLVKKGGLRPPLVFSVFGGTVGASSDEAAARPAVPETLDEVSAFIVGVGGLGTWVSGLLAATAADRCRLILVDSDDRVEEHNLNRQILYDESDIGKPKVLAARDALLEIRPDAEIHRYPLELTQEFIRYVKERVALSYTDPFSPGTSTEQDADGLDRVSRLMAMASGDAVSAKVFVSCLDNMQSRWILNCVAHLLDAPLVNGGVNGFIGTADFIEPRRRDATLVTRYGESIKQDSGKVQCGGAIPILSIVTTNAVIASLEALLTVCATIGVAPAVNRWFFDGVERVLFGEVFKERDAADPLGIADLLRAYEPD